MNATLSIYSLSGTAIATAIVTESAISHEELMTADYVQLSWNSDTGDTLPAGAYITIGSERYSLLEPYTPTRANEAEYQYTPQFQSRIMAWQKQIVPIYTYEDDGTTVKTREMDWDFTGSPADAMYMVQQAIKNETGETWTVQLADSLPATITLSSQSGSIFSVLSDIAGQCETEWWADKATNTLYLSQCKHGTPVSLTVGENVGMPSVTASKEGYYTRFYVFGSTRNVTQDSGSAATNSIVNKRLTLDPATYPGGYIDARPNLQPGEIFTKTLYYDDIYPSAKLEISDVRARLKYRLDGNGNKIQTGSDDDGQPIYEQYAIWYFQIANFDFDPDTIIPQMNLSVSFETGQLAGRDFELTYHEEADTVNDTADVTAFNVKAGDYEILIDESEGMVIPGLAYIIPQDGDEVILYNIEMPAEYTASAREELAETATADIAKLTADNNSYEMDSNPVAFDNDGTDLALGQAVTYTNGDTTLQTRVLMVEKHLDYACQQRIRIGNEIIKGNTQQLREEVTQASQNIDILAAFNNLSTSLSNAYAKVQREMLEGFARIGNMWKFDPDDPTVIYSDFSAYVNGFLSAKGKNPEAGSEVSGATTLAGLTDVSITGTPGDGQVLAFDLALGKWKPADAVAGLDEEELAQYLTANNYAKKTDITAALEGYALKTTRVIAGAGLTGGGTLAADRTLGLATVGTAGTYTKVTVDAYGRVTGHSTLAQADIPALAISKITGLQDALDAKMDASQLSNLYRKRTDNVVTVSKSLSALVAENGSADAWNAPANTVLMLSNSNNALAFHLGGTMNERAANIQVGHNSPSYATATGTLYLNKLGGTVVVGNPAENPATLNVSGGLYASSYIQVGSARLRYDSANNALYVQKSDGTQCGFYATGFVSTKGANSDAGSVVEGASALSELEDVAISSPANGQALVYRDGVWKNEAIETGLTSVSWDDVEGTPTTLAGYGITDAYTKTEADGRYFRRGIGTIGAGADLDDYMGFGTYNVSAASADSLENFGGNYGYGILNVFTFANGRGMQLYVPDYNNDIVLRVNWLGTRWNSWQTLLTDKNYTGYTVTKTGGGASGTWGINISGNAGSATRLQTARTIALSGAVSGSATFDGSAGVTLSTTFNAQSLLTSLKTVDGSGCGLDADLLDGYEATDFYRKKVANAVSVSKALSDLVAENGSADAWNSPSNSSLFLTNNNNALSFYVGGTQNERAANIQVGHNSPSYATALGMLYLNRFGGTVVVGNPAENPATLNVSGGLYASSYIQVGSARLRYDSANNALYVQKSDGTQCGFYATGFMSAKGLNGDAGSAVAGATTLNGLTDVTISSPANGQSLVYRNGYWRNETVSGGGGSASVDWSDITGKPTWIGSSKPSYSFSEITGTPSLSISSSNATNLSINVEGASRTISDLYATYLGGTSKAGLFTGMTYSSNRLTVTIGGTSRSVTIQAGSSGSYLPLSGGTLTGSVKAPYYYMKYNSMDAGYLGASDNNNVVFWCNGEAILVVQGLERSIRSAFSMTGLVNCGTERARWKTVYSVNALNTSSDLRLKSVLGDIPLTVDAVAAAPSFLYRWKTGKDVSVHAGSAAQYWQQALPQAVTKGEDGFLAMEYDRIALAAVITTARTVIDHETRIKKLEQKIQCLTTPQGSDALPDK